LFDAYKLYKALKDIDPDLIIQRVAGVYTGVCACFCMRNKCSMIWQVANDPDVLPGIGKLSLKYPIEWIEQKILDYGIERTNKIVTQTKNQAYFLKKYYGRDADAIIPNSHPPAKEEIVKGKVVKVVWIANFKTAKRPNLFVRLSQDLNSLKNVKFVMIGKQQCKQSIMNSLLHQIKLVKNLEYKGEKSIEEVNQILSESHIFVNTSTYEGFPNTFIQSWMRKVPVVSVSVDPDDIIQKENIGFLSGTYSKMVKDVETLIVNSELRNRMGEKAQKFALHTFSSKNLDKQLEIIEK
jgi:glycosyltransferase involved in cell wall biosynthesis